MKTELSSDPKHTKCVSVVCDDDKMCVMSQDQA